MPTRFLLKMIYVIASIYLCWLLILVFAQDQLIFPRTRGLVRMGELDRPGVEVVWLDTEEGRLPGWFIPGRGASEESPQRLLVLLHGNGNIIDDWYDLGLALSSQGANVLIPEYRGYGHAREVGLPSEEALAEDVVDFIARISQRPEVDDEHVLIYGRSLGAALGAQVGSRIPLDGLFLHTPPISIASYAWQYGAPPFLLRHPFRTDHALVKMGDVPMVMVIHDEDEIVPEWHAKKLRALAPHAEFIKLEGTHNIIDTESDRDRFHRMLNDFANGESIRTAG